MDGIRGGMRRGRVVFFAVVVLLGLPLRQKVVGLGSRAKSSTSMVLDEAERGRRIGVVCRLESTHACQ